MVDLNMNFRSRSLVSSSSDSTLDACPSERDTECSIAGSSHFNRDSLTSILDSSSDDSTIKATSTSSILDDQSITQPNPLRMVQKLVPLNPQPLVGSTHNLPFFPPLDIPDILSNSSETIVSYVGTRGSRPSTAATTHSVRTEACSLSNSETGRPHSGDSGNGDSDAERERNGEEEDVIIWKRGNLLGQGAYGRVWVGLTLTGEQIAVKQVSLHPDVEKAEKQYEKLQHEVGLLRSLSHMNIVGYRGTDFDESTRTVNIFMEYVPGGSITQNLKLFGAFDETIFKRYTGQILDGIEYLHEQGIVHRYNSISP
jgi:hypothetical protein